MEIDEDVKEFLIEGYEYLNQIEGDLVALEKSDFEPEVMNRIYRSLHTIKGNSGFLGVEKLEAVAHAGESLLSRLRDRTIAITPDITSALLSTIDAVPEHMEALETTGEESQVDRSQLLDRLAQLQESGGFGTELDSSAIDSEYSNPETEEIVGDEPEKQNLTAEPLSDESGLFAIASVPISADSNIANGQVAEKADAEGDRFKIADTAIRVDVGLLDKLMNLVGELVLCRNQIL